MDKKEKKYALIQIPNELHIQLKKYCDLHGFKISALSANIIRKYLKDSK